MSIVTVRPESSILETLLQMQKNFVKHIIVILKNKPIGIVTERDINRFLGEDKTARVLDEIPIKHVMQKKIVAINENRDDYFYQCSVKMDALKIGSVILIDDNEELIGIVSRTDIVKAYANLFGKKYLVKDFMTKKIITCRKTDSLKLILNLINKNKISKLVVTDESGKPIGIITTNNLLAHSNYFTKNKIRSRDYLLPINDDEKITVEDLLNDELITVNKEDDLASAASLMTRNRISGVPVLDSDKNLIGVVTKTDVVKAFSTVGPHEELKIKYKELY